MNVNYQDEQGDSALHCAVNNNDLKLVNLLVKNFADIQVCNQQGQCPLHIACAEGMLDCF